MKILTVQGLLTLVVTIRHYKDYIEYKETRETKKHRSNFEKYEISRIHSNIRKEVRNCSSVKEPD